MSSTLRPSKRARLALGALGAIALTTAISTVFASGIFTLRGKLRSFNDTTYEIQTKSQIYEIKKAGLSEDQVADLKTKKAGQDVELVVSTEAVAKVRDQK